MRVADPNFSQLENISAEKVGAVSGNEPSCLARVIEWYNKNEFTIKSSVAATVPLWGALVAIIAIWQGGCFGIGQPVDGDVIGEVDPKFENATNALYGALPERQLWSGGAS